MYHSDGRGWAMIILFKSKGTWWMIELFFFSSNWSHSMRLSNSSKTAISKVAIQTPHLKKLDFISGPAGKGASNKLMVAVCLRCESLRISLWMSMAIASCSFAHLTSSLESMQKKGVNGCQGIAVRILEGEPCGLMYIIYIYVFRYIYIQIIDVWVP